MIANIPERLFVNLLIYGYRQFIQNASILSQSCINFLTEL